MVNLSFVRFCINRGADCPATVHAETIAKHDNYVMRLHKRRLLTSSCVCRWLSATLLLVCTLTSQAQTPPPSLPQITGMQTSTINVPDHKVVNVPGHDVRAGDTAILTLSGSLSNTPTPIVKVEDKPACVQEVKDAQITFRVPDGLSKGDHSVTASVADKPLTGSSYLSIYPKTAPTITIFYPDNVKIGDSSLITVKGTGLAGPPEQIQLRIGDVNAKTLQVDPEGQWFVAEFSKDNVESIEKKQHNDVLVTAWGVPAEPQGKPPVTLNSPSSLIEVAKIFFVALLCVWCVFGVVWLVFSRKRHADKKARELLNATLIQNGKPGLPDDPKLGFIASLVYEPENNTLSLSKSQFLWWLLVIGFGYTFLFIAQRWVHQRWQIPPLGDFAYTFLISLTTLISAQVVTAQRGAKAAGPVKPGWADLITNGGVLALDRVQQVFWTVVIGVIFIATMVGTYKTLETLPVIPHELLVLMGISSAGYLASKAAGKPGPIISQVLAEQGAAEPKSLKLVIFGVHLSKGPDEVSSDKAGDNNGTVGGNNGAVGDGTQTPQSAGAMPQDSGVRLLVDDEVQPINKICTLEPDADDPQFAKRLQVELSGKYASDVQNWLAKPHTLRIINADGKCADWQGTIKLSGEQSSPKKAEDDHDRIPKVGDPGAASPEMKQTVKPVLTELVPTAGSPQTSVTLTGKSFGQASEHQVIFDDTPLDAANVIASDYDSQITLTIPDAHPNGKAWEPGQTVQVGVKRGELASTNTLPFVIASLVLVQLTNVNANTDGQAQPVTAGRGNS